jgi:hypothetical protein
MLRNKSCKSNVVKESFQNTLLHAIYQIFVYICALISISCVFVFASYLFISSALDLWLLLFTHASTLDLVTLRILAWNITNVILTCHHVYKPVNQQDSYNDTKLSITTVHTLQTLFYVTLFAFSTILSTSCMDPGNCTQEQCYVLTDSTFPQLRVFTEFTFQFPSPDYRNLPHFMLSP